MKWSFENENWRSIGWIMIWMIDFIKKMSEGWRILREKWRGFVHSWEMMMKWWKTSEEIIMEKCLMKMKCMGISLNGWFGHEDGWKRKKIEVKMDGLLTVLSEKEEHVQKNQQTKKKKQKKNCPTSDQAASRLLSGLGQFSKRLAAWLLSTCTLLAFRLVLINSVIILWSRNISKAI